MRIEPVPRNQGQHTLNWSQGKGKEPLIVVACRPPLILFRRFGITLNSASFGCENGPIFVAHNRLR